jgi:hypothetical protein
MSPLALGSTAPESCRPQQFAGHADGRERPGPFPHATASLMATIDGQSMTMKRYTMSRSENAKS